MSCSKILLKKAWLVFLIPFLFFSISAYIYCFKMTPLYEANTKLIVINNSVEDKNNNATITYNDLLAEQVLVKNYKELIKSRSIAAEVIRELSLYNITEEELVESIDVNLITDSNMLVITSANKDARQAKNIANEVSQIFIDKASDLMKVKNISIVDDAEVSLQPVYPKKIQNIAIVTFLGIFLSLLIIFLIAFFDDTIGNSEEIERKSGIPVIGIIPKTKIN